MKGLGMSLRGSRALTAIVAALLCSPLISTGVATAASDGTRCDGTRATIVGTPRGDVIKGTPHRDVIVALGGSDRISGRGGSDIICADAGNDTVDGGSGNDYLY